MALNFPDAPVIDEEFVPVGLTSAYVWDGVAWLPKGSGASTAPPEYLPLTGGTLSGPLLLPTPPPTVPEEAGNKKYIDEAIAAQSLYQGVWQPATNVPDLTPAVANPLHSYSWVAQTVDPLVPETPPAGIPGLTGVINSADTVIWNDNLTTYEIVRSPAAASGFVPLTGGAMTGMLDINTGISLGLRLCSTAGVPTMALSASSPGHTGLIEFFDPDGVTRRGYIGYGSATWNDIVAENGAGWKFANQLTLDNGVKFANFAQPAGSEHLLTRHLDLYGGTFGLSISGSTLNYVSSANHVFRTGATAVATLASTITLSAPVNANGAINCYERLRMMPNQEIWLDSAKVRCPEGSKIEFHDANNYITSTNNNRIRYDSNDSHRFFISGTNEFSVTSGGGALRGADAESLANGLGLVRSGEGDVSIGKAMVAMMAKIKQLENQIATLTARPRR